MKHLYYLLLASTCLVTGCAHRISIIPNTAMMNSAQYSKKIRNYSAG